MSTYAALSLQNVKIINADCFADLDSVPMHINFRGADGAYGNICFHLENVPLAQALVKAINDTLTAFAPTPISAAEPLIADDDMPF